MAGFLHVSLGRSARGYGSVHNLARRATGRPTSHGVIGGPMRFALLTGDETADEYRELITNLRDRQRVCEISSIRDELDADINEALELLEASGALVQPHP